MNTPKYFTVEELLNYVIEPYRQACLKIYQDNLELFLIARGSTNNHQAWHGGYHSHLQEVMNYAFHLYDFDESFGRPLPFTKSDTLLVMFLHDLEKPWRIELTDDGIARNRLGFDTKEAFKKFREDKLNEYGVSLTPAQLNGLTYVEGEIKDYSSEHRVMNELAAFCHKIDNWMA